MYKQISKFRKIHWTISRHIQEKTWNNITLRKTKKYSPKNWFLEAKSLCPTMVLTCQCLHMSRCTVIRTFWAIFATTPKSYATIFLGFTGLHFGPTNTNHTKNYQKITFGVLFSLPPQNALQGTTVHCNVL